MQRLLQKSVLKSERAVRRLPFHAKNLRAHQFLQFGQKRLRVGAHHRGKNVVVEFAPQRGGHLSHLAIARHAIESAQHEVLQRGWNVARMDRFANDAGKFLDQKRHSAGALINLRNERIRKGARRFSAHQFAHLAPRQAIESEAGLVSHRRPWRREFRAESEDREDPIVQPLRDKLSEKFQRRCVNPMEILNHEEKRLPIRASLQPLPHRAKGFLPFAHRS